MREDSKNFTNEFFMSKQEAEELTLELASQKIKHDEILNDLDKLYGYLNIKMKLVGDQDIALIEIDKIIKRLGFIIGKSK